MTDVMTTCARFRFRVAELGDGTPWILLEPERGHAGLENVMLGPDLKAGTKFEQAKEIARYLNGYVEGVSVTRMFDDIKGKSS